ncbi:glutathionylspermidine synthase family protein [Catellatospora tritici]|uniref:glutathionylspermidine synthase family protein n=1 Tax=Catellatospora tritici TaxID=2851566 RepID=UPI001C2D74DF|nr:glutathionylspermidine synthase family protein [Catellatospora tritici]MBV1855297.1 glutathionylspermidine synthase family protein [Catellatospora tritici]
MRRVTCAPREGWREIVESQGLVYAIPRGQDDLYWDESAYYEFGLAEVEALEEAVAELHEMCVEAAGHVVESGRYADLGITDRRVIELIERSWARRDTEISLYGRFDLRYDGSGPAKMLEYNADTPTSLLEAAGPQWFWLEQLHPGCDQWNSLHERLVEVWRRHAGSLPRGPVHFAYTLADEIGEDLMTAAYLQECAEQAGLHGTLLPVEEIGWDPVLRRFVDEQDRTINTIFKLYPWEWLVTDDFGGHVLDLALAGQGPRWIEPAWKLLLTNKALLAILWERHPGHPNLLPAYLDGPRELAVFGYVEKPLLGREGAGVRIVTPGHTVGTAAQPGERLCYQAFHALPEFGGNRTVLGAWVVDGEPAGLGIRETAGLITDTTARFLPHLIRG